MFVPHVPQMWYKCGTQMRPHTFFRSQSSILGSQSSLYPKSGVLLSLYPKYPKWGTSGVHKRGLTRDLKWPRPPQAARIKPLALHPQCATKCGTFDMCATSATNVAQNVAQVRPSYSFESQPWTINENFHFFLLGLSGARGKFFTLFWVFFITKAKLGL